MRASHLSTAVLGLAVVVLAQPPLLRSEAALTPEEVVRHLSLQEAASVRVDAGGKTVYFDPFFDEKVEAPPADLIVITHDHDRHCSAGTVARILKPGTTVIAPEGCRRMLSTVVEQPVALAVPGATTKVGEITVEAVPAYTPHHPDHARERGGVGYVVTLGGVRIYHSGSTELVPELKAVRADVAVLAFWEGYIMSTADAAELARSLQAKIVVPTHCKPEEAVKLRDLLKGTTQVALMEPR
jgi:L-ascorbate metabolism protein UlaG (beta-lactamase superfamily)